MSGRVVGNVITFAIVGAYVAGRIAYGGPGHATLLDIFIVLAATAIGSALGLRWKREVGK